MLRVRTALAFLTAVALPACSGTDTVGPATTLRADEARALALSLSGTAQQFDGSTSVSANITTTSTQATTPFTIAINQTLPCPDGGTLTANVTINGQRGPVTGEVVASMSGTVNPVACAYSVSGGALTVTGRPDLNVSAHLSVNGPHPTGTISFAAQGVLDWASTDGRTGTCPINFTSSGNFGSNTRTVRGQICGIAVNFTGSM